MAAAIDISDLSVHYQGKTALHDVTVSVPTGAICGLVGMNGAGKSTLFKAVMNIAPASSGRVSLLGRSVKAAQKQGLVAYVPQIETVDWDFPVSVRDVVLMGRYGFLNPLRLLRQKDYRAADKAIERVGLTDFAERQIGQLSGGQRKRVFVARALAQGAKVLLLDEPFAGVDVKTELSLIALLRDLQSQGITTLIAEHNLATIENYCDHVILLNRTVVASGPAKQTFTKANISKTYEVVDTEDMPWK